MRLLKERCTGCGYCLLVCPCNALKSNGWAEVISANCTNCNLCVPACPSGCFVPEPEFPLRPYAPRVKPFYDIVIVGSGIGGLMAGAALAQAGYSVAVFEKLSFPGGRYTELNYRETAVTTGAWTNLGPNSHIGRFLIELGIELDYVSLHDAGLREQYSIRFPNGRMFAALTGMLTPQQQRAWLKAILNGRRAMQGPPAEKKRLESKSAAGYMAQFCSDPDLLALVDATAATISGVSSAQMPAAEYIQIMLDGRAAGRNFAIPVGGVRAIIKALTGMLRQAGGALFVRTAVESIRGEEGRAVGITLAGGRPVGSRLVIHNGGAAQFVKLAGAQNLPANYVERLAGLKGVECAALFCATRAPLFTEAPITMTPNCRRVTGIFSPTLLDPGLSKKGLHLADAFFPLHTNDRTAELALALADMRDLFPNFDKVVEWATPMFFTGSWPGTESGQIFGQTGQNRLDTSTPLQNCFLVGMDVKGSGVAGDLIPIGVRQVIQRVNAKG